MKITGSNPRMALLKGKALGRLPNQGFGNPFVHMLVPLTLLLVFGIGFASGLTHCLRRGYPGLMAVLVGLVSALIQLTVVISLIYLLVWVVSWRACPKRGTSVLVDYGPHKGSRGMARGYRLLPLCQVVVRLEDSDEVIVVEGSGVTPVGLTPTSESAEQDSKPT
jgi:hypothetical protein